MSDESSGTSHGTKKVDGKSSEELSRERTFLAAERTLFAVLRTGLAIAAGGTVIISLLGDDLPDWVQIPLAAAFLILGYYLVLQGLRRYHGIAKNVERQSGQRLEIISARDMTTIAVVLQVVITIVVILYFTTLFW